MFLLWYSNKLRESTNLIFDTNIMFWKQMRHRTLYSYIVIFFGVKKVIHIDNYIRFCHAC
ncbi:hypothetical protein Hanom_Chr03g00183271 [Helianthus anomalus]